MMNSVQDAIYNWLTIKVVYDQRPDDTAAKDTVELFDQILKEDHHVEDLTFTRDEEMYLVNYSINGEAKTHRFPTELIEVMINQINQEPERYPNYKNE